MEANSTPPHARGGGGGYVSGVVLCVVVVLFAADTTALATYLLDLLYRPFLNWTVDQLDCGSNQSRIVDHFVDHVWCLKDLTRMGQTAAACQ
jgi:hypothetical protein